MASVTSQDSAPAQPDPWKTLGLLVEGRDRGKIREFLSALAVEETALVISRLESAGLDRLLDLLDRQTTVMLITRLPDAQARGILERLPAASAARIVESLPEERHSGLIRKLGDKEAAAVLDAMDPEQSHKLRERIEYEQGSAGDLMTSKIVSYRQLMTVGEVLWDLAQSARQYAEIDVQYIYVVSRTRHLRGVLRLRDLVMTDHNELVRDIMIQNPLSVRNDQPLEELKQVFAGHRFLGVPVVDASGRLLGLLSRNAVQSAAEKKDKNSFLMLSGIIGGEETRNMSIGSRSVRRLSWLIPNILLNIVAATIIAMFEDTLEAVIALAVFLPIVSDMSGCSGNQAVAVTMREVTLGLLKPSEVFRVFRKECGLGILNGLVLGLVLGSLAALWRENAYFGLVIGGALMLNTVISVIMGGLVPLGLKRMKIDPALASNPILTTATDMTGFFLVLSFANLMLDKISY